MVLLGMKRKPIETGAKGLNNCWSQEERGVRCSWKKIGSGTIFVAVKFEENRTKETYTILQPAMFYPQASSNGTYMIYVLLRHTSEVSFVLCVLWQKKRPTFMHRWFQGYIENFGGFWGPNAFLGLGRRSIASPAQA